MPDRSNSSGLATFARTLTLRVARSTSGLVAIILPTNVLSGAASTVICTSRPDSRRDSAFCGTEKSTRIGSRVCKDTMASPSRKISPRLTWRSPRRPEKGALIVFFRDQRTYIICLCDCFFHFCLGAFKCVLRSQILFI